ncbi:MAG: aminotransferase class V-fold PLP-dependent enzyme, partial [Planctomycetota bacterium]|nr:aminotransferase class V-fold PLP-dependent enzyme [Planctomycetota bacterium]
EIPFPIDGPDTVVDRILAAVTDRTRLVLVDHVTSPTGLVLPIGRIVSELSKRGIDTLVDGAHGPGMLPLNLGELGAAYYTGNCHKWMCAPKGAAFLHVRRDRQEGLHPVSISHGWDVPRDDRPRLHLEFDWVGTVDPTAWLSVPAAIEFMESVIEGGWPAVMQRNRETALKARAMACDILGIALPAPEGMVGSLASVPLPDGTHEATGSALYVDPLQEVWLERFGVEVPIIPWPRAPKRLLRISAQVYNGWSDYERLAEAIRSL